MKIAWYDEPIQNWFKRSPKDIPCVPYVSIGMREGTRVGRKYQGAIKDFLEGHVDTLFSVVAEEPFLHNNRVAKEMLIRALMDHVDDSQAYRSIVKLAKDAGVPLINPAQLLSSFRHKDTTSIPRDEAGNVF